MKKIILLLTFISLAGCGYSSRGNEMIGQVKKVAHATPIICPDWTAADISLGILRNGVGSMSTQDVWVTVSDKEQESILKEASEKGSLVKIKYDVKRLTFCVDDHIVSNVEAVRD